VLLKNAAASDPDNAHAFPYMWGSIGIGYNPEKVKEALGADAPPTPGTCCSTPERREAQSLRHQFPRLADRNAPGGPALPGLPGERSGQDHIAEAEAVFMKIRPSVAYFHSSKYISDLANGNICVAVGYSGDVLQARPALKKPTTR
jgi:putrescine transport system substrate-binding protein